MAHDTSPHTAARRADDPPPVDADLESALLAGLADDPPAADRPVDDAPVDAGAPADAGDPAQPPTPDDTGRTRHETAPSEADPSDTDPFDADFASALLDGLAEFPPDDEDARPPDDAPAAAPDAAPAPAAFAAPAAPESKPAPEAGPPDTDFASALLDGFEDDPADFSHISPTDGPAAAGVRDPEDRAAPEPDPGAEPPGADFAAALLDGLDDFPPGAPDRPEAPEADDFGADLAADLLSDFAPDPPPGPAGAPAAAPETIPGIAPDTLPDTAPGADAAPPDAPAEPAPAGPPAALAFATDGETENALREGLLYFEGQAPGCEDPQVWPGGLRAAVAALGEGQSAQLVIVDIDGVGYPAGALHELAEVCEVGTAVIAVGSYDTARTGREILLAGVSDYLVKPIDAAAVRAAVARATADDDDFDAGGRVAGFAGTGGSGATTLAATTALRAAEQGRYVSVLDLGRTVAAAALQLDVDPAPGLDQLFDMAGPTLSDPQVLDGVRTERSDRIAVYAYRLGPEPPPVPPMAALDWLLALLRRRSQLVLVDGMDDPETCFALLAEVDARVLVVEPTTAGAQRAAHILAAMGTGANAPVALVQNHTRAFRRNAGAGLLAEAGVERPPGIVVPFQAAVPDLAGRGWPQGRLPRRLRKPAAALAERILAPAPADLPAAWAEA